MFYTETANNFKIFAHSSIGSALFFCERALNFKLIKNMLDSFLVELGADCHGGQ